MPTDPDDICKPLPLDIKLQTIRVMDNLSLVLKGIKLDLDNVISVRVFLTDFDRDYQAMNKIYAKYFNLSRFKK